jgi:hypothetical protein
VEWILTAVALGVMAAGMAGSMARVARRASVWQDQVEERWRQAAARVGGRLEVGPRRSVSPRHLQIVVEREDAVAVVEVNVPVDTGAPSHTRAHARFAVGRGPLLRVWDPGPGEPAGGAQVLPEPLGRRFRAAAPDEAAARAIFSQPACVHLAGLARALDLRSNGEGLELVWDGVELDPETLLHAVGAVSELAQAGVATLRALAALEDATYVPVVDGGPAVRLHRERVDVSLSVAIDADGPRVCASTPLQRSLEPLELPLDDPEGLSAGALPAGVLAPEAAPLLGQVGRAVLTVGAHDVELTWGGDPSASQAEAGARLVALVAAGSGRRGAFR